MKEVEKEALRRGSEHAFIETQGYDSMLFYESIGYFVTKKTEESGATRYSLQKELYPQRMTQGSST
jgi:hypothetical protein